MDNEKKEWQSIMIRWEDHSGTEIRREDLEKIEAIDDVIDALERAKNLTVNLRSILGE